MWTSNVMLQLIGDHGNMCITAQGHYWLSGLLSV